MSYKIEKSATAEILVESICFKLDSKFGSLYALPILAAFQSYVRDCNAKTESWNLIHKENRKHELALTIVCSNDSMRNFLCRWLSKMVRSFVVLTTSEGLNLSDFDYYVDITMEKVFDIIKIGNLHFSQGIGTLIGCNSSSLADLSLETETLQSGSLLIVGLGDLLSFKFEESLNLREKFSSIIYVDRESDGAMGERGLDIVREVEAVIGWRGLYTYAASCLRKPVLELSSIEDDFWMLTQWSNKFYVPIVIGQSGEDMLKRGVIRLWEQVLLFRSSLTTTAQEMSIVESVID